MGFNENQKEFIKSIGFDPDDDYTNHEKHLKLHDVVEQIYIKQGFDVNYELTEAGKISEAVLDTLADM